MQGIQETAPHKSRKVAFYELLSVDRFYVRKPRTIVFTVAILLIYF